MPLVTPHARSGERPERMTGNPGMRNPATFMPSSLVRCARYQRDGEPSCKCVSFSSTAAPLAVLDGAMVNEFDPPPKNAPTALSKAHPVRKIAAYSECARPLIPMRWGGFGTWGCGGLME